MNSHQTLAPCGSEISPSDIEVIKLGGSILRSPADLAIAVGEVRRAVAAKRRAIIVVSAFHGTTDQLLSRVERLFAEPDEACLARLLATGETASASFIGMQLLASGLSAQVLDTCSLGLRADGPLLDARLVDLDTEALYRQLAKVSAIVVPGFFGYRADGTPALLGRGGSDLTALFLADRLRCRCRLVKDTGALYTADPHRDPLASRYRQATWETVLRCGGEVVQPRAVRFASSRSLVFTLAAPGEESGTVIGPGPDVVESPPANHMPEPRIDRIGSKSTQARAQASPLGGTP